MSNDVLIWGDWLSCDPLRGSHDSQSPHIWGDHDARVGGSIPGLGSFNTVTVVTVLKLPSPGIEPPTLAS